MLGPDRLTGLDRLRPSYCQPPIGNSLPQCRSVGDHHCQERVGAGRTVRCPTRRCSGRRFAPPLNAEALGGNATSRSSTGSLYVVGRGRTPDHEPPRATEGSIGQPPTLEGELRGWLAAGDSCRRGFPGRASKRRRRARGWFVAVLDPAIQLSPVNRFVPGEAGEASFPGPRLSCVAARSGLLVVVSRRGLL